MRKIALWVGAGLLSVALALTGCSQPETPDDPGSAVALNAGQGALVLNIGGAAAASGEARTTGPVYGQFTAYEITLTDGSGTVVLSENVTAAKISDGLALAAGNYTVDVIAFVGEDPSVTGSTPVAIVAGKTTTATVSLDSPAEPGAKGTFDYSVITYPATIFVRTWDNTDSASSVGADNTDPNKNGSVNAKRQPVATLTLTPLASLDGGAPANSATPKVIDLLVEDAKYDSETASKDTTYRRIDLPEGVYTATLYLDSGNSIDGDELDVTREEAVYIYPHATTVLGTGSDGTANAKDYLYQFTVRDFQAGFWVQGEAEVRNFGVYDYDIEQINLYNAQGILIGKVKDEDLANTQGSVSTDGITGDGKTGAGQSGYGDTYKNYKDDEALSAALVFQPAANSGKRGPTDTTSRTYSRRFEYYIEEVTKELMKSTYEGNEAVYSSIVSTSDKIWVEIVAKSASGQRLRSYKQSYSVTNKHGVLAVNPSMEIYELNLRPYSMGDITLTTDLNPSYEAGPKKVPTEYRGGSTADDANGRIVLVEGKKEVTYHASDAWERYDVVYTSAYNNDVGVPHGTPYKVTVTAGENWGLMTDRVFRQTYGTTGTTTTWSDTALSATGSGPTIYTDATSNEDYYLAADFFNWNGWVQLAGTTTHGYLPATVSLSIGSTNLGAGTLATTTTGSTTLIGKTWTKVVTGAQKYLTSGTNVTVNLTLTKSGYATLPYTWTESVGNYDRYFAEKDYDVSGLGLYSSTGTEIAATDQRIQLYRMSTPVTTDRARITVTSGYTGTTGTTGTIVSNETSPTGEVWVTAQQNPLTVAVLPGEWYNLSNSATSGAITLTTTPISGGTSTNSSVSILYTPPSGGSTPVDGTSNFSVSGNTTVGTNTNFPLKEEGNQLSRSSGVVYSKTYSTTTGYTLKAVSDELNNLTYGEAVTRVVNMSPSIVPTTERFSLPSIAQIQGSGYRSWVTDTATSGYHYYYTGSGTSGNSVADGTTYYARGYLAKSGL